MNNRSPSDAPSVGQGFHETDPLEWRDQPRQAGPLWSRLPQWLRTQTMAPSWLPRPLRSLAVSYLAAVIMAGSAVALTLLLEATLPAFGHRSLLVILGVVLVALTWGSGPSLVATLVGALLVEFVVYSPSLAWSFANVSDDVSLGLVLGVGLLISLVAGQVAQARLQAEQARKATKTWARELETILETITDGVVVVDQAGHTRRINRAGLTLLRRYAPPDGLARPLGKRLAEARVRDETGHVLAPEQAPVSRVLRGETLGGTGSAAVVLDTLSGADLHLEVSGAPLYRADGQQVGAVVVSRDVTERRRLEQHTQHTLAALIEVAHGLLGAPHEETMLPGVLAQRLVAFTSEALGEAQVLLTTWDPATGRLQPLVAAGFTPEQENRWRTSFEGTSLHAWWGAEVAARLEAGEVVQIADADATLVQAPNVFGVPRHMLAPLLGERGLSGFLALGRSANKPPFTPQEESLLLALAHFCGLVLEQERLLFEREEARAHVLALHEANRQMDTFLSIVSHELRTPVTTIKGSVQLLLKRGKTLAARTGSPEDWMAVWATQQQGLRRVETQIARLTRLLDDLIDLARLRSGKLEVQVQACDLDALVEEVVEEQRLAHPDRVISLPVPTGVSVRVLADADRTGQVLTNYLTNALKYSPPEQPVEVGVTLEDGQARVWVRDHGPGIPPEEHAKLWNLFHRVPGIEVQSGSGIGLGLGLYISKTMMERQGGQVGVESAPGAGSTFWLTLPLALE